MARSRVRPAARPIIPRPAPPIHVVGAAILDGARCLVAQRGAGMSEAGRWEFPGGKVEPRESPQAALVREIREELGTAIAVGAWLGRGEAIVGGRAIVLDVYAATREGGDPEPREHAALRWIGADEIGALDWPEADRPILPFLRRVLQRGLGCPEAPLARPIPIVSVDWAKDARQRAVYTARPAASGWRIGRAEPPKGGWSLDPVLALAESLAAPFAGACLVAIDAVLGLPGRFAERLAADGFLPAIDALEASGALARSVGAPAEWSPASPFFAVAAGAGGLTRFLEAAGGRATLYRQIERATGANPVFAVSGIPGTVGSGSAALWRELLALRKSGARDFRVWPFEIELEDAAASRVPILAESYPRACYAIAAPADLPVRPIASAKTKRDWRIARLERLRAAPWLEQECMAIEGFESARDGEDDFDALMQAAALVRLVAARYPLSSGLVDPIWEGGILGTGGVSLAPRRPRWP